MFRRPNPASGGGYEVALNCGDMVVWASQGRLCLANIFLQAARNVAAKLTVPEGSIARQSKVNHQLVLR